MNHDNNNQVIARVEPMAIPTYREPESEKMPMFAENRVHQRTSGNPYPRRVVVRTDRTPPEDKVYQIIRLENDYIRLIIIPELGGRIFAATDKTTGYDFFYRQHVIKPALIGVLGSWISGGVEFNWPFHHRPSTFMPVDFTIERQPDGEAIVWLSEHDPLERMKGMVGISLCPGQTVIKTHMKVFNRTAVRRSFLWWENAAVPVNPDYQIFFPPDVHYVNFHYHRSVTTYPIASGVYNGIRLGAGTDITRHRNTRAPTSYFSAPTKFDFFGGYDHGRQCGVVHVADRHTSPGKKMFTWAYNQLAHSWEKALTDTDGAYAELMAGSYSDNQPDFAWLAPYETKEFEQCWYPIAGTGSPVAANCLLALGLQKTNGQVVLHVQATRRLAPVRIIVNVGGQNLLSQDMDLIPGMAVSLTCPDRGAPLQISIQDTSGHPVQSSQTLLTYLEEITGSETGSEAIPAPWKDLPAPHAGDSAADLYLLGLHVKQYRDPCVTPDAYWLEALVRDPDHVPTLLALGEYDYQLARFPEALAHLEHARQILTRYNGNPADGHIFYLLGLVRLALGQTDDAYDAFAKASWNQAQVAAAMTWLACLDGRKGDYAHMQVCCRTALASGSQNGLALGLSVIASAKTGRTGDALTILAQALAADPLNQLARLLNCLYRQQPLADFVEELKGDQSQTVLDLAFDLMAAGQSDEAAQLLQTLLDLTDDASPMVAYTLASLSLSGIPASRTVQDYLALAKAGRLASSFPFRLEELAILRQITTACPEDATAWYFLGCLLYSKRQYAGAADCWTRSLQLDSDFYIPRRNLAVACYSHLDRRDETLPLLMQAYDQAPADDQLLYEICHVMTRTGTAPQERAVFIADHAGKSPRPDIILEWANALNQSAQPEAALALLAAHAFIPCEGGEHAVAEQYLFAKYSLGRRLLLANDPAAALVQFRQAQVLPDNLGAGLWHEAWLVPHQYYEAVCLENLGQDTEARCLYEHIAALPVDYFSNMHLPGLPCWQAMSCIRLGRKQEAQTLLAVFEDRWRQALTQKDAGYFKATPFFISYMDQPESLRQGLYGYLIGLAQAVRGDLDTARVSWQASRAADPGLLFCWLESELLKEVI